MANGVDPRSRPDPYGKPATMTTNPDELDFPGRLAFALKNAGLSPGQLDRLMSWSPGWTRGLLAGKKPLPPVWETLAAALGVSVEWISTGLPTAEAGDAERKLRELLERSNFSPEDREKALRLVRTLG